MLALEWDDVNFDNCTVRVNKMLNRVSKGKNAKLIGVINKTVMDNPVSSANIGIYIDAYKLLEINEEVAQRECR